MRDAETALGIIQATPKSRMTRKCHVRFGGGPMEKERHNTRHLASGLPYEWDRSATTLLLPEEY